MSRDPSHYEGTDKRRREAARRLDRRGSQPPPNPEPAPPPPEPRGSLL